MKNKLALTALAIAMTGSGVAAATEVKVGGVVQIRQYLSHSTDGSETIHAGDVRINVSASEEVGDYTGFANYRIDADALSGNALSSDSIKVGFKGDFGAVTFGHADDVKQGELAGDILSKAGRITSAAAWGYTGSFGPAKVGVIWSPEDNDDAFGAGVTFAAGPATIGANFGSVGTADKYIVGAKAGLGPVTLAANVYESDDDGTASDSEGFAVKASGSASGFSWGVGYAKDETGTTEKERVRVDVGTSFAGLGVGLRFEDTETVGGTSTDFLRLQLAKKF